MTYPVLSLRPLVAVILAVLVTFTVHGQDRNSVDFTRGWRFHPGDLKGAEQIAFDDSKWRDLNLPHDWSIEGEFSDKHPAGVGGGALPGGIGWYRKTFDLKSPKDVLTFIEFDGIYRNSEVWINGHFLGKRPNGYISFKYELTPYIYGDKKNVIAVRVDNGQQPNSRWYSGSGIYRNVKLTQVGKVYHDLSKTFITSPVQDNRATVHIDAPIVNTTGVRSLTDVIFRIVDATGKEIGSKSMKETIDKEKNISAEIIVDNPKLWSVESPYLYTLVTELRIGKKVVDRTAQRFGIRYFSFDAEKGFSLNGRSMKLWGVCNHHDLGALGAAVNRRALERQLQLLKAMGVNSIRTSHNPPAAELLDLCDEMGFVVMDEMFDMWKKKKSDHDYSIYWDEWHKRDLEDFIIRDRNHPSVIMWSIGNEILEQWDSTGTRIAKDLASIVRSLDTTRPITAANNAPVPDNKIIQSGVLDLIGFNYNHDKFENFPKTFPGQKFIATETTSALATRGHYDMPSDSIRRWPIAWDKVFTEGNPGNTVSAYDNVSAPWGSTHEETLRIMKKHSYLSGMFIWTGFDYLGEPTPYIWPSRSSYFGVLDLAGFPKDAYYLYQSEWTNTPVLHIFPHWNWKKGETVDVWAYYNQADEVELFLNGKSLGSKKKSADSLHVMWRLKFEPGTLKAVSRKNGKTVLTREVRTAGKPAKIVVTADRPEITSDGKDLSYITIQVVDENGTPVPDSDNLVTLTITGPGEIIATDNGDPVSHASFQSKQVKVFHGLAIGIVRAGMKSGRVEVTVSSPGLSPATAELQTIKSK
jgi:beta-galactosidase